MKVYCSFIGFFKKNKSSGKLNRYGEGYSYYRITDETGTILSKADALMSYCSTHYQCEYNSLLFLLYELVHLKYNKGDVVITTRSKFLVDQIYKNKECNNLKLRPKLNKVLEFMSAFTSLKIEYANPKTNFLDIIKSRKPELERME